MQAQQYVVKLCFGCTILAKSYGNLNDKKKMTENNKKFFVVSWSQKTKQQIIWFIIGYAPKWPYLVTVLGK